MWTSLPKLESLVQRPDCAIDGGGRNVTRDLERRGRDDDGFDPGSLECGKRSSRDAGMALHPRSDEGDLAQVVTGCPVDTERIEGPVGVSTILDRRREDDLRPGLDDRVDV